MASRLHIYRGGAFGPLAGVIVQILKVPISFSFKYEFEIAAQNRSTGNELWLSAVLRF